MIRLTVALAIWIGFAAVASASLTAGKKSPALADQILQPQTAKPWDRAPNQAAATEAKSEFTVTDQTEIFLDGKPCKYTQVPSHANIVRMEVAADRKTVLRIEFQAGK